MDAASDGDVVTVCAGTYTPVAWTGTEVSLVGVDGSDATFIDMATRTTGVEITRVTSSITISGFTVLGAGRGDLRGISLNEVTATLSDIQIVNLAGDSTDSSSALWVEGGAVDIDDLTIENDENLGHLLYIYQGGPHVMRHSSVHACEDVDAPVMVQRSEAQVSNNLFYDLTSTGTVAASFGESDGLETWVYNNVFYQVGDSDYSVQAGADVDFYNNIIVATTRYGLTNSSADTGYNIGYGASILDFFGTESATDFSDDPQFVDAAFGDFTLDAGFSPAVDAGNPLSGYDDVDGTTNDIGAFGGPFGVWTP